MHIINRISPLSDVDFVRNSSKLSPISHFVTREVFFAFETFNDDLGTTRSDSPNSELDLRLLEQKEGEMDGGETNAVECLEETLGRTIPRA
ncbi:hypothetical protein C7G92_19045 [Acinetobacter baumannii]|nr:hypothetical protein C7G92_19045 [Acinetobacter baumannii]